MLHLLICQNLGGGVPPPLWHMPAMDSTVMPEMGGQAPQYLANQLTLFKPGGQIITTWPILLLSYSGITAVCYT